MQGIQPANLTDEEWLKALDNALAHEPDKPTDWKFLALVVSRERLAKHLDNMSETPSEPKDPRQLDLF